MSNMLAKEVSLSMIAFRQSRLQKCLATLPPRDTLVRDHGDSARQLSLISINPVPLGGKVENVHRILSSRLQACEGRISLEGGPLQAGAIESFHFANNVPEALKPDNEDQVKRLSDTPKSPNAPTLIINVFYCRDARLLHTSKLGELSLTQFAHFTVSLQLRGNE